MKMNEIWMKKGYHMFNLINSIGIIEGDHLVKIKKCKRALIILVPGSKEGNLKNQV